MVCYFELLNGKREDGGRGMRAGKRQRIEFNKYKWLHATMLNIAGLEWSNAAFVPMLVKCSQLCRAAGVEWKRDGRQENTSRNGARCFTHAHTHGYVPFSSSSTIAQALPLHIIILTIWQHDVFKHTHTHIRAYQSCRVHTAYII